MNEAMMQSFRANADLAKWHPDLADLPCTSFEDRHFQPRVVNECVRNYYNGYVHSFVDERSRAAKSEHARNCGWASLSQAAPRIMSRGDEQRNACSLSLLVAAYRRLHGPNWKHVSQWQDRGTCVGQATSKMLAIILMRDHFLAQARYPGYPAVAWMYGAGRHIANSLSRQDGSIGAWTWKACREWGFVTLNDLGIEDPSVSDDPREPMHRDEMLAVQWAAQGVPQNFRDVARKQSIESYASINALDELNAALLNGMVVSIGGPWIPSGNRNEYGESPISRRGGHETLIVGVYWYRGKRFWLYMNSWGDQWADGPAPFIEFFPFLGMFSGCVVALSDRSMMTMIRDGELEVVPGTRGFDPLSASEIDRLGSLSLAS